MIDNFEELKRRAEELAARRSRKEGELSGLMRQLKERFGCRTLQEAEKLLDKMSEKERRLARRVTAATKELERSLPPED